MNVEDDNQHVTSMEKKKTRVPDTERALYPDYPLKWREIHGEQGHK